MPLVLRCLTSTLVRRLGAGPAAAVPRRAFRGEGLIEPRPICSIFSAMRCPARAQARSQHVRGMAMSDVTPQKGTVMVTIIDPVTAKDGRQIQARIGASVLDVAQEHDMELEGACEGTLACSTCHCIFTKELYAKLPPPDEEELDMLDLAAGLTDTSRLGCQVKFTADFEGAVITIPDEFNNLQ